MNGVPFSRNNYILNFDIMVKENLYLLIQKATFNKCEK